MLRLMFLLLILLSTAVSCRETPGSIPEGRWEYDLIMNGSDVGDAWVSVKKENGNYINETELKIEFAGIASTSYHKIIETENFIPVSVEVINISRKGSTDIKVITKAAFTGSRVSYEADGKKSEFTLNGRFRLEGNYVMAELIKGGFKKGLEIKYSMYDPSIELDETIPITVKVEGYEKTVVGGEEKELLLVRHTMKNFKSIRTYLDRKGIVNKMILVMLNNKIELELK